MKELSREYISSKIPIMIIANKCDKNKHENRDDLLKEVKNYFGEEYLFDKTSIKEKTSDKLNKILEELTSPSNQFKFMMEYATRLYSFEIPKKVIYNGEQIEGLTSEDIKSFLWL
ncbi:2975_t:CDS:2, partial [Cetraspora pellucida]